jgi:hypothetical protein
MEWPLLELSAKSRVLENKSPNLKIGDSTLESSVPLQHCISQSRSNILAATPTYK